MDFGMPFLLECPSIEAACALCAKLGLQFVELNLSFPLCNLDVLTAQRLNALRTQYSIYFTFHLDEELSPCDFDSHVRAAYLDCTLRAITLARETGTPSVNLHWPRGVYVTLPDRVVRIAASANTAMSGLWTRRDMMASFMMRRMKTWITTIEEVAKK